VGETVAFFPAEIGPTSPWLAMDHAVIDQIDYEAESFRGHSVDNPAEVVGQGFENVVRVSPAYHEWRAAWESTFERTGDEQVADSETESLRLKVLAEHPIHGRGPWHMPGRNLKDD
jgi:hypothetical protein